MQMPYSSHEKAFTTIRKGLQVSLLPHFKINTPQITKYILVISRIMKRAERNS